VPESSIVPVQQVEGVQARVGAEAPKRVRRRLPVEPADESKLIVAFVILHSEAPKARVLNLSWSKPLPGVETFNPDSKLLPWANTFTMGQNLYSVENHYSVAKPFPWVKNL
jgi:hypothetical protein